MSTTKIEWTATRLPDGTVLPGYTFNPWIGCTKVSEGCKNCYAEADFDKRRGIAKWGANGTRVVTSYAYWRNLIKWNKQAKENAIKRKVFVGSLCDIFEDWQGQMLNSKGEKLVMHREHEEPICFDFDGVPSFYSDEYVNKYLPGFKLISDMTMQGIRNSLFQLIPDLDGLIFIFCTKRPENWRCVPKSWQDNGFPKNVWVLTSTENQEQFDKRVVDLLEIPVSVRGVSMEPLKGPIDFGNVSGRADVVDAWGKPALQGIHWVIAGGESGPKAEPSHPDWFRSLRDQCVEAGVPFFFKQWGEWYTTHRRMGSGEHVFQMWRSYLHFTQKLWAVKGDACISIDGRICSIGKDFMDCQYPVAIMQKVGKKAAGRLLDGVEWSEMPE